MSRSLYEIVEVEDRGKLMIATMDMLPGTQLFEEEGPLLFFPGSLRETGEESYREFQNLSPEQQQRFLDLYGPTTGVESQLSRLMAMNLTFQHSNEPAKRKFTKAEVDIFVKVNSIARMNMFAIDNGHAVYEIVTRMSHSCLPNCSEHFQGRALTCRTILPISAGQELTIEYNTAHRWKPTHVRRQIYCTKKEFTCHCPRCDAEADDTREFDCHDPQCPGSHFACQPINKEIIPFGICSYTGVEYVEPHLLPCTVCHRAAPLSYQLDMFALEKNLDSEYNHLQEIHTLALRSKDSRVIAEGWERLHALQLPRWHSITANLLKVRYNFAALSGYTDHRHAKSVRKGDPPTVEVCARELVRMVEHRSKFPSSQDAETIVDTCFVTRFSPDYSRPFALECCRKALRMYLLIHGRDTERKKYNDMMLELLKSLPPPLASANVADCSECMFCGESPLRAALTLSRCGRCRQVAYCSVGCQKAHWPLHKKRCKKTV